MKKLVHLATPVAMLALTACADIVEPLKETLSPRETASRATPQTAKDVPRYGAIAFSDQSQRWRFRWNVVAQQRAIDLAIKDCGDAGCRILLTFGPEQCGTFALGRNGVTAAAVGRTAAESETAARAACNKAGKDCKVAPAQCNG